MINPCSVLRKVTTSYHRVYNSNSNTLSKTIIYNNTIKYILQYPQAAIDPLNKQTVYDCM